jgi:cell wall assembly regulator SMI1
MKDIWQRIETFLAENAPPMLAALNPGATPAEIAEIEKVLGITLPPDLRETYLIHNGCADYFFFGEQEFLSLQEVLETWERWRDQGDWDEPEEPDEWPETVSPEVRVAWFHPHWFPFATHEAYCTCVDLAPAKAGEMGQVIEVEWQQSMRTLIVNDFRSYLEGFLEDLEDGAYVFSEEKNGWVF